MVEAAVVVGGTDVEGGTEDEGRTDEGGMDEGGTEEGGTAEEDGAEELGTPVDEGATEPLDEAEAAPQLPSAAMVVSEQSYHS